MKYRETVEENTLGEAGKRRVVAAVMQGLEKTKKRSPFPWKRALAASLSLVLATAIVVPSVYFSVGRSGESGNAGHVGESGGNVIGPSGGSSGPDIGEGDHGEGESGTPGNPGDPGDVGPAPTDPDGIEGGFTRDYQVYYEAGETIKLTCKVYTAHTFSEPVIEEKGFTAVSVELISQQPDRKTPSGLWMEYTYEVELNVTGEGTALSVRLTFETDNALSLICGFWGYRPIEGKHAGRVFCSHISGDSAFRSYLNYLLNAGEIAQWQYDEMLSEYWRNSASLPLGGKVARHRRDG